MEYGALFAALKCPTTIHVAGTVIMHSFRDIIISCFVFTRQGFYWKETDIRTTYPVVSKHSLCQNANLYLFRQALGNQPYHHNIKYKRLTQTIDKSIITKAYITMEYSRVAIYFKYNANILASIGFQQRITQIIIDGLLTIKRWIGHV